MKVKSFIKRFQLMYINFENFSVSRLRISIAPWEKTLVKTRGPIQRDLNFPRNNFNRESKSKTLWPIVNYFLEIKLSCKALVFAFLILEFLYASRCNSSNS